MTALLSMQIERRTGRGAKKPDVHDAVLRQTTGSGSGDHCHLKFAGGAAGTSAVCSTDKDCEAV